MPARITLNRPSRPERKVREGMDKDHLDGRALASALWAARGDLDAMARVSFRFRQEAALKRRMG